MPITTTFDGTGMTLRQKLTVGAEILCQTCPTCGGSGSGSGSGILCSSGVCGGNTISSTLTLSVNEVYPLLTPCPLPTGDFLLTYSASEIVARELDQSEQPCIEYAEAHFPGWYSEWLYLCTDEGCDYYYRWWYDACNGGPSNAGDLRIILQGCNADCPDNNPPIQNGFLGTLAITCSPYFASISNSPTIVASVSE